MILVIIQACILLEPLSAFVETEAYAPKTIAEARVANHDPPSPDPKASTWNLAK